MTEDEFRRLASTYGGDLGRWPASLQREAAALAGVLQYNRELQAELAFDERIDAIAPDVSMARADVVAAAVARTIARSREIMAWRALIPAAFALSLLGFVVGLAVSPAFIQASQPQDTIVLLLSGANELGFLSK
jgi:hypothetical protein